MNTLRTIHKHLLLKQWTIGTAESLTAGMIASTLASQAGASAYLRGGIVAYTLDAKVGLLGVDREVAAACNCVSAEVAMQMALGLQKRLDVDCAIAVTGYATATSDHGPHAYYTVICGTTMSSGRILGGLLSRNRMRKQVVTSTLTTLAMLLKP